MCSELNAAVVDAQRGDKEALAKVIEVATDVAMHTGMKINCSWVTPDDVGQAVAIIVLRNLKSIKEPKAFVDWVLITAKRYVINCNKHRNTRHLDHPISDYGKKDDSEWKLEELARDSNGLRPDEICERKEEVERAKTIVAKAMQKVIPSRRAAATEWLHHSVPYSKQSQQIGVLATSLRRRAWYGKHDLIKAVKEVVTPQQAEEYAMCCPVSLTNPKGESE